MNQKVRYFFDMDGTLARFFDDKKCLVKMYKKGYFEHLKPYQNIVESVRQMIHNKQTVYILTKCVNTPYCVDEKRKWLAKYLPELTADKMIFITDDTTKSSAIKRLGLENGINVLYDDYGVNLTEWETALPNGIAVKVLNGINGKTKKKYVRLVYAD